MIMLKNRFQTLSLGKLIYKTYWHVIGSIRFLQKQDHVHAFEFNRSMADQSIHTRAAQYTEFCNRGIKVRTLSDIHNAYDIRFLNLIMA